MGPGGILAEAARALAEHRLRSAIATLGVLCAVAALVAMTAVGEGARRHTLAQLGRLGADTLLVRGLPPGEGTTGGSGARAPGLEPGDAEALARGLPALAVVAPLRRVAAAVAGLPAGERLEVVAATHALAAFVPPPAAGRFLLPADGRPALVCVLGAEAARLLGAAGRPGGDVRVGDRLFRVVGVLERRAAPGARNPLALRDYDRAVIVPLGAGPPRPPGAVGDPGGGLAEVAVRVRPGERVEPAAAAVRRLLALRRGGVEGFQVVVPRELLRQQGRTRRAFGLVLAAIAGVSLLVGAIGIANALLAGVAERTREIGIRRAIGASRREILEQFLAEALLLTAAGATAGLAAGAGLARVVTLVAGWETAPTWWGAAAALAMAVGAGLAAGVVPALRASRLDPVEALRRG